MNINLKDTVVKIHAHLNDKNRVPVGRKYLLDRGWNENRVDVFCFIWCNMTISVGIILLMLIVYN